MDEGDSWGTTGLRHALQRLASPAEQQLALFPDFVPAAEELWLTYTHSYHVERVTEAGFSGRQQSLITSLDEKLTSMWESDPETLWTDDALRSRSEWADVREMAMDTLAEFGWPIETPPSMLHAYAKVTGATVGNRTMTVSEFVASQFEQLKGQNQPGGLRSVVRSLLQRLRR